MPDLEPDGWNYLIVWEFRVPTAMAEQFERLYGPAGVWAQFFHGAQGFVRTELVRDTAQQGRYLTFDFWTSGAAYERFRQSRAAEYQAIDVQCEQVTESEIEVGRFERGWK